MTIPRGQGPVATWVTCAVVSLSSLFFFGQNWAWVFAGVLWVVNLLPAFQLVIPVGISTSASRKSASEDARRFLIPGALCFCLLWLLHFVITGEAGPPSKPEAHQRAMEARQAAQHIADSIRRRGEVVAAAEGLVEEDRNIRATSSPLGAPPGDRDRLHRGYARRLKKPYLSLDQLENIFGKHDTEEESSLGVPSKYFQWRDPNGNILLEAQFDRNGFADVLTIHKSSDEYERIPRDARYWSAKSRF